MKIKPLVFLFGIGFILFSAQPAFSDACSDAQDRCDEKLKTKLVACENDYDSGSNGLKNCKKYAVKNWTQCHDELDQNVCKDTSSGGNGAGYNTKPCPAGTQRSPLGICMAYFKQKELPPGKDGCPPGEERGNDDRCVPSIKIKVVPFADGYLVACPNGMKPSPIDGGCVPNDVGPVEAEVTPGRGGRECPEGMEPGPQGGPCVPVIKPGAMMDKTLVTILKRAAAGKEGLPTERPQDLNERLMTTHEVERVIDSVTEGLEAERVEAE